MAANQTILFTVIPTGISINDESLPVSVIVSPRLSGEDKLGAFPDWLNWTGLLKENGLEFVVTCNGESAEVSIDTGVLRPDLWKQLFNEQTLVRSHEFNDYTGHGMISYSVRDALTAIKTIYQDAGLNLALPGGEGQDSTDDRSGNRQWLGELVNGLEVHWNSDNAKSWREAVRRMNKIEPGSPSSIRGSQQAFTGPLDHEGLYITEPNPTAFKKTAIPFSVFHHMPTPKREGNELELDTENLLDFHQVLSSLNVYPELQRALGLVFDLKLSPDFVKKTAPGAFGTLAVSETNFEWEIVPVTPDLETAYVYFEVAAQQLFFTAPRILDNPSAPVSILGLLTMDPRQFGLAQVDVDGAMHKSIMLAETIDNPPGRNLDPNATREPAPNPEVFDPDATLPSLRSGGFSLFADRRGILLLDSMTQAKAFNDAVENDGKQPRPFFVEDLVRGYRLDVWDSHTGEWHSLHRRNGKYLIGEDEIPFDTENEEGFFQTAAMQPAEGAEPDDQDLYLHEAIARWAGWSLSAPQPAKHLSKHGDPDKAIPPDAGDDPDYLEDQPDTPFKMTADYKVVQGSLPRLKFGTRYRIRARAVDLAGNSMELDDPLSDALAIIFALPRDPEGTTYMRYEPVIAPLVVLRDEKAVTGAGSGLDRLVIRTFNDDPGKDTDAADTAAGDRHIVPPRTSAEMGIRLGMFDDDTGTLKSDAATWQLIADRDSGEFQELEIDIAGKTDTYPLEPGEKIDALPYLPDLLSRGAAIRDLPGTPAGAIGKVTPDAGSAEPVTYAELSDPNPRAGSATMISFGDSGDWEQAVGFRLALAEPQQDQTDVRPHWDPENRLLKVFLPKGQTTTVPLSSYMTADDLKLMGVWQWIREYIERITVTDPQPQFLQPGADIDRIAHILQRAVEGGHWMLTPPKLLTLVHAVQQPIGRPGFIPLNADHEAVSWDQNPLQTTPVFGREDPAELAAITAWRRPAATDAFLLGALKIHGSSTVKVDIRAEWEDPVDDISKEKWGINSKAEHVEELPLAELKETYLPAKGKEYRPVGYYDPEHDQIVFVRTGDVTGVSGQNRIFFSEAAPRHLFNDTKHHVVKYTAVSTSRYQEYFSQDEELDFTRTGEPVTVDVPASARPLAPDVLYVLPTFGWQRQTETNLKRSVRFGGGLRVYMRRPWFSSGEGELLGVALWSYKNGPLDEQNRDKFKPYFTQWGMDPIWQTDNLYFAPNPGHFPDAVSQDYDVSLEESTARISAKEPGRVSVVGFEPQFDESRGLWYADLTINTYTQTYMPFVRLALVRYQPHALADAKISRVVLADFAQLTPDRSAMVTSDPHHARVLRVTVSGVAPRGPKPVVKGLNNVHKNPTRIFVRVQQRDASLQSDLAWQDVDSDVAAVNAAIDDHVASQPDLMMWSGTVTFAEHPEVGQFRLLIEEYEYISANYVHSEGRNRAQPGRLIYAETFELDDALVSAT